VEINKENFQKTIIVEVEVETIQMMDQVKRNKKAKINNNSNKFNNKFNCKCNNKNNL